MSNGTTDVSHAKPSEAEIRETVSRLLKQNLKNGKLDLKAMHEALGAAAQKPGSDPETVKVTRELYYRATDEVLQPPTKNWFYTMIEKTPFLNRISWFKPPAFPSNHGIHCVNAEGDKRPITITTAVSCSVGPSIAPAATPKSQTQPASNALSR